MAGPGRPGSRSKLTESLATEILQLIEVGNYIETACAARGLHHRSYYLWLSIGQRVLDEALSMGVDEEVLADFGWGDSLGEEYDGRFSPHELDCLTFLQAANKAAARSEAYAVTIVRQAMPANWTAAMTFLERRFPGRWKRRDLREVASVGEVNENERAMIESPEANAALHEALEIVAGDGEIIE